MGTKRETAEKGLDPAPAGEAPRKIKERTRGSHFQAGAVEKAARLEHAQGLGVAVKGDSRHDGSRSRIPRVVLEKGQDSTGFECTLDPPQELLAARPGYMMKNIGDVDELETLRELVINVHPGEREQRMVILPASAIQHGFRAVHANDRSTRESPAELARCVTQATAEVENAPHASVLVTTPQLGNQKRHSRPGKILRRLTRQAKATLEPGLVLVGKAIELTHVEPPPTTPLPSGSLLFGSFPSWRTNSATKVPRSTSTIGP